MSEEQTPYSFKDKLDSITCDYLNKKTKQCESDFTCSQIITVTVCCEFCGKRNWCNDKCTAAFITKGKPVIRVPQINKKKKRLF